MLHSATSAEGSEPGAAAVDFATVHYVMLVTESYLRLYTAEGLRQGEVTSALAIDPAAVMWMPRQAPNRCANTLLSELRIAQPKRYLPSLLAFWILLCPAGAGTQYSTLIPL